MEVSYSQLKTKISRVIKFCDPLGKTQPHKQINQLYMLTKTNILKVYEF